MIRLQMLVYSLLSPEAEGLIRAAEKVGVEVVRTADCQAATDWLNSCKFDGVAVDSALLGAERVLQATVLSTSNKNVAALSIISAEDAAHRRISACTGFALWKGSTPVAVSNTFRVLYVCMVAERQRYFRCPTDFLVRFSQQDAAGELCFARASNLSRGGMAMTAINVYQGDLLTLEFRLPNGGPVINVIGKVLRSSDNNRAAVRFISISDKKRALLYDWLTDQCVAALADCKTGIAKGADESDHSTLSPSSLPVASSAISATIQ